MDVASSSLANFPASQVEAFQTLPKRGGLGTRPASAPSANPWGLRTNRKVENTSGTSGLADLSAEPARPAERSPYFFPLAALLFLGFLMFLR